MSLTIDIAVDHPSWTALGDLPALIRRAIEAALTESGVELEDGTELSCLLCDDATIRNLNAQWRGLDKPTNVLSFPAAGPGAERLLGDIVLAYETVAREAEAESKPIEDHAAHLLVHGVLHLVGHDHEAEAEAEIMEALEIRALKRLGLANPYDERARAARDLPRSPVPS